MVSGGSPVTGVDTEAMRRYLATTDVVFAVVFGSRVRGDGDERSDVDVALGFPDDMGDHERFRLRNRIDANLQTYADGFVDVSDLDALPTPVAYAALRDGTAIVGDRAEIESALERFEAEYEASAEQRERERREFIDRLARGDV